MSGDPGRSLLSCKPHGLVRAQVAHMYFGTHRNTSSRDAERRSSPGSRQTAGTRLRKRNRESYISIQGGPVYSNNASVPRFSMLGQWAAKLRGAFTRRWYQAIGQYFLLIPLPNFPDHLPSMPAPTPPILRSTPLSQTGTTRVAFR